MIGLLLIKVVSKDLVLRVQDLIALGGSAVDFGWLVAAFYNDCWLILVMLSISDEIGSCDLCC